jgi:hypothetical protein
MPDGRIPQISRRAALFAAALLGLRRAGASDGRPEFVVIVHPSNPARALTREFVSDAFLKRATRFGGGEPIRPVDLHSNSAVRRVFSQRVLKRSVAAVRSYWQQRIFSGRGVPPPELDSEEAVVRYVMKHEGGLGYVGPNTDLGGVKAVEVRQE